MLEQYEEDTVANQQLRHTKICLEIPLEIHWRGTWHRAKTAHITGDGALILSSVLCPLGSVLKIRNLQNDRSAHFCVTWSWADKAQRGARFRLRVDMIGHSPSYWDSGREPASKLLQVPAAPDPDRPRPFV